MRTKIFTTVFALTILGSGYYFTSQETEEVDSKYEVFDEADKVIRGWKGAEAYYKSILANQHTGEIDPAVVLEVQQEIADRRLHSSARGALDLQWQEMGPDNVGGRTRAILVDKDNANRIYMGSVGGGLFVSDNAGGTWEPHDDLGPNLLVSCLDQAPNGDVYFGTGCNFEGTSDGPGAGLFRSTDGGATFTQVQSTVPAPLNNSNIDWVKINALKIDPTNSNTIYAATNNGLRVSTDGGTNWNNPIFVNPPDCTIPANSEAQDIDINSDGRVFVVINGGLWYSDDPTTNCTWVKIDAVLPNSSGRMAVDIAKSDNNQMYAIAVTGGGQLENIYESEDKGTTWKTVVPSFPTPASNPEVNLFGDNGQGIYDLAIAVDPQDPGRMFVGGVQLYRFDGNWTRATGEFLSEFSPFYVHSDKHYFYFDPHNPNIMYVCSDGGLSKSIDAGVTFFTANRGYNTTQYYDMAVDTDGKVAGGTQDNGSIMLDPMLAPGLARDGNDLTGGDGFGTEISQITNATFTTIYNADLYRANGYTGYSNISGALAGTGPFRTTIGLWENANDLTSKDSVEFVNDANEKAVAVGTGTNSNFSGTVVPDQPAATIVNGSLSFVAGVETMADADGDGTIDAGGAGTGTVTYNTNGTVDYNITWNSAPGQNLPIEAVFNAQYTAGDTLFLLSKTADIPIDHILTSNLNPGDILKVQDPVQSLLALGTNNAVFVSRNGLRFSENVDWVNVTATPFAGTARCIEFSEDGNIMYIGTAQGSVYRIDNLNEVYDDNPGLTTSTQVYSGSQTVTGIAVNPNNPNHLVVTLGNWGNDHHVVFIDDAATRSSAASTISHSVHTSSLPKFPIFDAEFDINNPSNVLLGTTNGVWATNNIFSTSPIWEEENTNQNSFANVDVWDLVQQKLPFGQASNFETIYAATHGRGFWRTTTLVSTDDRPGLGNRTDFLSDLKVYPNPMKEGEGFLAFEALSNGQGNLRIYDLQGRIVNQSNVNIQPGDNNIRLNVSELPAGTFIVTLETQNEYKVSKFVVAK